MRKPPIEKEDIEICKEKINAILREFNCTLVSADDWSNVLILDKDTNETISAIN